MILNKVVARFKDGRVVKGRTNNFFPNKPSFHIMLESGSEEEVRVNNLKTVEIPIEALKGAFFVKDLEGDRSRKDKYEDVIPGGGRKVKVKFFDGEVIIGYTQSYSSRMQGFFIVPADKRSNNLRIFVVKSAVDEVTFIP
jgi:hypothetical protein